jgi:signal peptidase I
MRMLSRFLSGALYVAVIGIMVFAILANFLAIAQSLFSPLNVVQGDSMSPTIKSQDAVLVTSIGEDLKEGEIVVFRDPEDPSQNIMHRIVRLEQKDGNTYAVTKGDGNDTVDPFMIPAEMIWGKVSFRLPNAGAFLDYLKSKPGFILCVVSPFLLLLIYLLAGAYLDKHASQKSGLARELIPCSP